MASSPQAAEESTVPIGVVEGIEDIAVGRTAEGDDLDAALGLSCRSLEGIDLKDGRVNTRCNYLAETPGYRMSLEEAIRELEERLGMSQSEEVEETGRMVARLQD